MISFQRGTVIAGRYRLERALAQGGMGCVWVARHVQLDTDVAIKFMTPQFAASADARARFEREAKASAQLKLANAVQVHDYGVEDGSPFLVMELLDGEDLEARLRRTPRLSLGETLAVLEPVCRALRRAHEVGLVHRDLKPGNIFISRQGGDEVVKILDFGIAKDTGASFGGAATRTGAMLGSPQYMSPEQVRSSNRVDHRSDLWSLGVIAFRCLTGQLPFASDEVGEVLVDVCTATVPRPSQVAPDLGPDVDRFFERALVRDLGQRFQSAGEFGEAFAALAAGTYASFPRPPQPSAPALTAAMAPSFIPGSQEPISHGAQTPISQSSQAPISQSSQAPVFQPPGYQAPSSQAPVFQPQAHQQQAHQPPVNQAAPVMGTLSPSEHTHNRPAPARIPWLGIAITSVGAALVLGLAVFGALHARGPAAQRESAAGTTLPAETASAVPTTEATVAAVAAPPTAAATADAAGTSGTSAPGAPAASAAARPDSTPQGTATPGHKAAAPAKGAPRRPAGNPAAKKGDDLLEHM